MLEKEYKYFVKNRNKLVKEHLNEFVVIKGEKILGFYSSENDALKSMVESELGTFLVQQCIPTDQTIQKYHSRVTFV